MPEKYRTALVLCDLEGKSRQRAALQLGCAEGTVASRLFRARQILAKRLARHGLAVPAAALATVLSQEASACVPVPATLSTIKAVTLTATGHGTVAAVSSATVAALTEGVIQAMLMNKLMKLMLGLLALVAGMSGAAGLIYHTWAAKPSAQAQHNSRRRRPTRPLVSAPLSTRPSRPRAERRTLPSTRSSVRLRPRLLELWDSHGLPASGQGT